MITYVFHFSLPQKLAEAMRNLLPEVDEEPFVTPHDIMHARELEGIDPRNEQDSLVRSLASGPDPKILVACLNKSRRKAVNLMLNNAGIRVVHLIDGYQELPTFEQASWLMRHWKTIVGGSFKLARGESVSVRMNGRVEKL